MIYSFTGRKQSGKSTACQHLEKTLKGTVRINFKDGLIAHMRKHYSGVMQAIADSYNNNPMVYDGANIWTIDRLFAEKPPLMRRLMQDVGQAERAKDPDVWVKLWEASVDAYPDMTVLTDDVRFPNEAEAIRRRFGLIARIERTDLLSTDSNISETAMDEITPDYTISVKTGEHDKLYAFLDHITEQHGEPIR
jgi:hypothetical protein